MKELLSRGGIASFILRYGSAVVCVGVATLLREYLKPHVGQDSPYITFYLSIAFVAWYSGVGPAVLAIVLSALIIPYYFLPQIHTLSIDGFGIRLWYFLYLVTAATLVYMIHDLRRATQRAERNAQLAEKRLMQLQHEVQQREAVKESLRESESRYRRIVETSAEGVWIVDADGKTIYANEQFALMLGYSTEDLIGNPSVFLVSQRDIDTHNEYLIRRKVGIRETYDLRLKRKDGEEVWTSISVSPFHDRDGSYQGALRMVTDITRRKQVEMALHKNQERLELAQRAAHFGIWDWNLLSGDVTWSAEFYTLYGIDRSVQPSNDAWLERILPSDRERVQLTLRQGIEAQREDIRLEFRITHRDALRWIAVIGQISYDEAKTPLRLVAVSLDVTERNELLEREQLARAHAEGANRTKDEFLATVSHELRTPLTAILGWSHTLRHYETLEASVNQALEAIERNARAQAQLIDDLLDISRIISGKLKLSVGKVCLIDVIQAAVDSVRPSIDAKGIRLTVPVEDNEGNVCRGDPDRLQQVVWNLLSNAVKFTPCGGHIRIGLERKGSYSEIRVVDSGMGIAPDFLPFVFDRFRQADGTMTRKHGGLGIGLAIVRHLVELHGGTAAVSSSGEGMGATFTIQLPIANLASQELWPATARYTPSLRIADLSKLSIVVVDDEPDTSKFLQVVLERQGASVRIASSVAEALTLIRSAPPDVLVSDIGMPGENGLDLIRQLRALKPSRVADIPAVALTAYARNEDRTRALAAGYQMHIAKPVEPDELVTALASLVQMESEARVVNG